MGKGTHEQIVKLFQEHDDISDLKTGRNIAVEREFKGSWPEIGLSVECSSIFMPPDKDKILANQVELARLVDEWQHKTTDALHVAVAELTGWDSRLASRLGFAKHRLIPSITHKEQRYATSTALEPDAPRP
jgi:hypothetical protein